MKVKCIINDCVDLTQNKIYDAEIVNFHGHKMYSIEDDSGDGAYLYDLSDFEFIEN